MSVVRQLVIETDRDEATVGAPVTVRVRDRRNRPVEGATVEWGRDRTRTDERGLCRVTFRTPGFQKLVARKSAGERETYRPATVLLRVLATTESTRRLRGRRPVSR